MISLRSIIAVLVIAITVFGLMASAAPAKAKHSFSMPHGAIKVSEDMFYLGSADIDGERADGYAIVHYKNAKAKSGNAGKPAASTCYGFMASGARWKTTEPFLIDSANADGMDDLFVSNAVGLGMSQWDSQVAFQIFGARVNGTVDGADGVAPDNKNELLFGEITDSGVIGVTTVWGYFGGSPRTRQLLEWDMVFDDVDFDWGDANVNPALMDFRNIATHELGHAAGLADLYTNSCTDETMYGYGTEGETKKRDLNAGDIVGIKTLYK